MPSVRAPAGGRSRPPIAVDAPPETLSFEESLLLIFPSFGRRVPAAGQCGRPRKRPRVSSGPPGLRGPGGRGLTPLGCCLSLGAEDGGGDVVVGAESFEQVTVSSFFLLDCSLPSLSRQRCHLPPSLLPSFLFSFLPSCFSRAFSLGRAGPEAAIGPADFARPSCLRSESQKTLRLSSFVFSME